ncbi:c-type cytochrome [Novosphingobium sp.]|uniref:c-type cytochrome n=1 Tax=Novosphingobium sp. TaxID=1874826 RepID=UPI0038BA6585
MTFLPRRRLLALPALLLAVAAAPAGTGDAAKGKELAENWGEFGGYACAGCHGADYRGKSPAPALAGRPAAELSARLQLYRTGKVSGGNAQQMAAVAATMGDEDVAALSAYLASLPR